MSARPPPAAPRDAPPSRPAVPRSPPTAVRVLRVDHETRYDYEEGVEIAHHVAYLRPREATWQRIRDWRLAIDPPPDDGRASGDCEAAGLPAGLQLSSDCWGNWRASFSHAMVHERLIVRSSFIAELLPREPIDAAGSPAWETVAASLGYRPGNPHEPAAEFSLPTRLASRDPALADLALDAFTPRRPVADGARALMRLIHEGFEYRPASTSVNTLATEALAVRRGVCQDFAHVMIGAMRSIGLAARYVSGYLLTHPPPGRPRLIGADATHAWVEAWCPLNGWIALDPTNDVLAGQDHVTVAWGRDYADVAPLRGVIRGGGKVVPRVAVTVEPLDDAALRP